MQPSAHEAAPACPTVEELSEEFFRWLLDSRGASPWTVTTYRSSLRDFSRRTAISDVALVTIRDFDGYMTRLALEGFPPVTRRNRMYAVKSFFRYLATRGFILSNPAAAVQVPPDRALEIVPVFTEEEVERLIFGFIEPEIVRGPREPLNFFARRQRVRILREKRDTALLALSYSLGLRASEPGLLRRTDYLTSDPRQSAIAVCRSKDSRAPTIFALDRRVQTALDRYLIELARSGPRGCMMFPGLSFRQSTNDRGVGRQDVERLLNRRVRLLGIEQRGRRLSAHTLRYSIATHLDRHGKGLPIRQIQLHLRHRAIQTTLRYLQRGSQSQMQKRAIAALPWNARRFGRDHPDVA